MSEHNIRQTLAGADPGILSTTDGELLEARYIWGAHYILKTSAASQTRKLVAPSMLGQKIQISGQLSGDAATLTIAAPSGTTFDGTDNELTFTLASGNLWVTLESFDVAGVLEWRITSKGAGVTIT